MAKIIDSTRALTVNPLKISQRVGAVLAFLGLSRSMSLEHGARGCTAFAKLFLMRHFREPITIQTTALDQVSTVMGADDHVIEGLETIIERNHPDIIGVLGSSMSEFQGADLPGTLTEFRRQFPNYVGVAIVPVSTFDGLDGLEEGYARAVEAIIETLVPTHREALPDPHQINILASAMLTPGDVETLKQWVQAFGFRPVVLPDLGDSLDGHLRDEGFLPLSYGGTTLSQIAQLGRAVATLVIGPSLNRAADLLQARTAVPDYRFHGLMDLEACDALTQVLHRLSGRAVPESLRRQRAQLLDAMVDCQFYTAGSTAAVAADPDLLGMHVRFLLSIGVAVPVAVSIARAPSLASLPLERVLLGDLETLEREAQTSAVRLFLTNSHAVALAARLRTPLLRVGFPQHDFIGAQAKVWIGYSGARQSLFDVANLLMQSYRGVEPYISNYKKVNRTGEPGQKSTPEELPERTVA